MAKFRIGNSLQKDKPVGFNTKLSSTAGYAAEAGHQVSNTSRISEGAQIQGELEFAGSLVLAGKLEGSIVAKEGDLELSKTGEVHGDIHCQVIDCYGQVFGDINVQGKSVLRNNCKIIGDIVTRELSIQNGAQISGQCKMLGEKANMDFFSMPIENLRKHLSSEKKTVPIT